MTRDRLHFLLLNIGHFLDHLFTLIFATVAALALAHEWGLRYSELLVYATPGFFAFGLFAYPAGWLADKWSREGMMGLFFVGIGLSSIATAFAQTPMQIGVGLFVIGVFAAIYHPVGLAMVTQKWKNTGMRIAVNGVWGNLGVASAALITGFLIDNGGWRLGFVVPGAVSIAVGLAYIVARWPELVSEKSAPIRSVQTVTASYSPHYRAMLLRVSAIVFITAAISGLIFQATTFALPKILDERLQGVAKTLIGVAESIGLGGRADFATVIGAVTFIVFAVASIAQLIVGKLLDRYGARPVFMGAAAIQVVFFLIMPGLVDGLALAVAIGFMLGAFGQIPITDYLIGKLAAGEFRARVYGVRYVVSFTALAAALPLIAFVYERWGFDTLFVVLAATALAILIAVGCLPRAIPTPETAPAA